MKGDIPGPVLEGVLDENVEHLADRDLGSPDGDRTLRGLDVEHSSCCREGLVPSIRCGREEVGDFEGRSDGVPVA